MATAKTSTTPKRAPSAKAAKAAKKTPLDAKAGGTSKKKTSAKTEGTEKRLVRASAGMKKRFEEIRRRIQKLRTQGSEAFDDLYEEIARVLDGDPPLYLGGGYRTREAFIAAELPGETLRSVQRNVLVALCFSPEDEARHGITFLEEVALYAKELAGAAEPPRAIDLDKLRVPVKTKDGGETKKPVRKATVEEIRKARRALRKGVSARKNTPAIEKTLRGALGKRKALSGIAVRAVKETVSLGGIPVAALKDLGEALAKLEIAGDE